MSAFADRSETIGELAKALTSALGELEDVAKTQTAKAGTFSYKYATLADALGMARPILAKHGVSVMQTAETDENVVSVWTTMMHSSGEYLTHQPTRLPSGVDAQKTGSAITYARRYSLMAALGLATEDDDGASASAWGESRRKPVPNDPVEFRSADKVGERRTFLLTEIGKLRNINKTATDYTHKALGDAKARVVSEMGDDALESLYKALTDISYLG